MMRTTMFNNAIVTSTPTNITTQPASVRKAGSLKPANTLRPTEAPNSIAANIPTPQATSEMTSPITPRHKPNTSDTATIPITT